MNEIIHSELFAITLTCVVYFASQQLYIRTNNFFLFHPVLISIATIILVLSGLGLEYSDYEAGGKYISGFLGPAVVALGLPLYMQIEEIKKEKKSIITAVVIGSLVGVISGVVVAYALGASKDVLLSLAPKSVTTPIAMSISDTVGGIPALTAVIVVIVGIGGSIIGIPILKAVGIKSPKAIGLAMGAAAHGIGTAQAAQLGKTHAAYGGLALGLCGVCTAIITPYIMPPLLDLLEMLF
ncbi:LrgB family protein [Sediminitomix flava]|uniref:Putative murein hydrolase (TIGR00659 family) n=1 Tax=Sediminitomix flava TaxID=379075 RepID=A0A315Z8J0_SEDFL|nr:LrgB family protein [Sediminitomix flava]PWJ39346.1 putative murein hydrolase (TIGR00659 family) [Sediminitomix flava]